MCAVPPVFACRRAFMRVPARWPAGPCGTAPCNSPRAQPTRPLPPPLGARGPAPSPTLSLIFCTYVSDTSPVLATWAVATCLSPACRAAKPKPLRAGGRAGGGQGVALGGQRRHLVPALCTWPTPCLHRPWHACSCLCTASAPWPCPAPLPPPPRVPPALLLRQVEHLAAHRQLGRHRLEVVGAVKVGGAPLELPVPVLALRASPGGKAHARNPVGWGSPGWAGSALRGTAPPRVPEPCRAL